MNITSPMLRKCFAIAAFLATGSIALATTITFEVDVSGSLIPLDAWRSIDNPPAPNGTGAVSIAGSLHELGYFTPNLVWLRNDGIGPDRISSDNIWTFVVEVLPGTLLRYRYTIGAAANEGSWPGTEEFTLTDRGYTVPDAGGILIQDIFADRPLTYGTLGQHAIVTVTVPDRSATLGLLVLSLAGLAALRRKQGQA